MYEALVYSVCVLVDLTSHSKNLVGIVFWVPVINASESKEQIFLLSISFSGIY